MGPAVAKARIETGATFKRALDNFCGERDAVIHEGQENIPPDEQLTRLSAALEWQQLEVYSLVPHVRLIAALEWQQLEAGLIEAHYDEKTRVIQRLFVAKARARRAAMNEYHTDCM